MRKEFDFKENMTLDDVDMFLKEIQEQSNQIITEDDLEKIQSYVLDNEDTVFFFGNDLQEKYSQEAADKLIIDTGILNQKNQHLFLSLIKDGANEFRGHYVLSVHAYFKNNKRYFKGKENT